MVYKPDSVFLILSGTSIIYLDPALLLGFYLPTPFNCLHTHASSMIPLISQGDFGSCNVHDISARKVYPTSRSPGWCVRFYHTFSPLSRMKRDGIVSVTLSVFAKAKPIG